MHKPTAPLVRLGVTYRIDGHRHTAEIEVIADGRSTRVNHALAKLHDGREVPNSDIVSVGPVRR